jgi:adenine-specific DNA-methyltransferase
MPIRYIPYDKVPVQGQAILDNITRTQRLLRYKDNDKVYEKIIRGLPYYELKEIEKVGENCDNLIIRGECLSACAYLKDKNIKVDLVYIDPPFASEADYAKKVYIRKNPKLAQKLEKAQKELDIEELKSFEEKMYGDIWSKEDYLNWMSENLMAIKEVMSETASIYVHLDWHIGHYVKILLDEVFGEENFRNEIVWRREVSRGMKTHSEYYSKNADYIFLYTKNSEAIWNGSQIKKLYSKEEAKANFYEDEFGFYSTSHIGTYTNESLIEFHKQNRLHITKDGKIYIDEDGILKTTKGTIRLKYYLEKENGHYFKMSSVDNIWEDIRGIAMVGETQRVDYATQKPEALLERIIKASTNKDMIVADFFGGSGVTAKVANDLGRKFIHCDIGINSIQTTRDRLKEVGAEFQILEVQDGVNLFRNPIQTMDKLASLIDGLNRKKLEGISNFWFGTITDTKFGTIPVYVPNLRDSTKKLLDIVIINEIVNKEIHNFDNFDGEIKKVIIYYIDIVDLKEIKKFIKEYNQTLVEIELRDLKQILDFVVIDDKVEFSLNEDGLFYEVEINSFYSDRLNQKIDEYNSKQGLKANGNFITISENGLELIEYISLDCTNDSGVWQSDSEIKIDKKGFVSINGNKTKEFWNGKISSSSNPKRLKIRNISGDETIKNI